VDEAVMTCGFEGIMYPKHNPATEGKICWDKNKMCCVVHIVTWVKANNTST